MRDLMKQSLASIDLSVWPTVALVIFSVFLAGTVLWIMRPGAKELYDTISQYPIDEPPPSRQRTKATSEQAESGKEQDHG